MKSKIVVNFLLPLVIIYVAVIADGIFHLKDEQKTRGLANLYEKRGTSDRAKSYHGPSTQLTARDSGANRGILRPESSCLDQPKHSKCVGKTKTKRYGCHITQSSLPYYGGCCQGCCCHECDEGCWCPIPGAEAEPEKKPEEPCCCPCCCPCCPTPCCQHCCHHHVYHHHHCPSCHCCHHCCHCCPCCCCHCCHCKRSRGPLAPSLLRIPGFMYMNPLGSTLATLSNYYGLLPLAHGPLKVH